MTRSDKTTQFNNNIKGSVGQPSGVRIKVVEEILAKRSMAKGTGKSEVYLL